MKITKNSEIFRNVSIIQFLPTSAEVRRHRARSTGVLELARRGGGVLVVHARRRAAGALGRDEVVSAAEGEHDPVDALLDLKRKGRRFPVENRYLDEQKSS